MLFFTGLARTASEIVPEQIKNIPSRESELNAMRAMVDEAINVLNSETDLREFGKLLHETWMLKKSLSSVISSSTIDNIYDTARAAGAEGGKLLGAGSGGFVLFYVEPQHQEKVRLALANLLHVPFRFDTAGSQVIYYSPSYKENFPRHVTEA